MRISCPTCQYTKDMDDTSLPAETVFATCPQCGNKFRFREDAPDNAPEPDFLLTLPTPAETASMDQQPNANDFAWEAREPESPGIPGTPPIPWAYRATLGYPAAFVETVRQALFTSGDFFSRLTADRKTTGAMSFCVVCLVVGFISTEFWAWGIETFLGDALSETAVQVAGGEFIGWGAFAVSTIALIPLGPLFLLLSAAILYSGLWISRVPSRSFGACANVYAFALSANVFSLVPFIGQYLAAFWGLYLLIVGLRRVFAISVWRSLAALLAPPALLLLITLLLASLV